MSGKNTWNRNGALRAPIPPISWNSRLGLRLRSLKRRYRLNHKGPKLSYLVKFPEHRLGGWLCDGNGMSPYQSNHPST